MRVRYDAAYNPMSYEYKLLTTTGFEGMEKLQQELNRLAKEGWRCIAFQHGLFMPAAHSILQTSAPQIRLEPIFVLERPSVQ